jgi:transposase
MIVNVNINNDYEINCLNDLVKLNMDGIKTNKTQIAKELGVSRKTVRKYMKGYEPIKTRKRKSKLDPYYDQIFDLLYGTGKVKNKIFYYKRNLFYYCLDNKIIPDTSESTFKDWLKKNKDLNDYFKTKTNKVPEIRFETSKGEQAQVDWKESLEIVLNTGEVIEINILVVILSYSRFRYYGVSLNKNQDILFNHLDNAFKAFGGVPETLLTDNMKTVMDEPRTNYSKGKINNKFKSFSDDYGFKTVPCIAGKPQTKAKVEQPMRILDYLKSFNGDLTYLELIKKIKELNNRENNKYHEGYGLIPTLALQKEKDSLHALPKQSIRNQYNITDILMKVDTSAMVTYKQNKYSVPPKYLNKQVTAQVYDNKLHVYFNTKLITIHQIKNNVKGQLFYHEDDYKSNLLLSNKFKGDEIESISQSNLNKIGEKYNDSISTTNKKS